MQPVVLAESNVGHQKSKSVRFTPCARGVEPTVTLHVRERRRGRVQDADGESLNRTSLPCTMAVARMTSGYAKGDDQRSGSRHSLSPA